MEDPGKRAKYPPPHIFIVIFFRFPSLNGLRPGLASSAACGRLRRLPDDSPDRTWERLEEISRSNPRVRLLHRTVNPGLSPSVIEGFANANSEAVAGIDADPQHDPTILPAMLQLLDEGCDVVVVVVTLRAEGFKTGAGFVSRILGRNPKLRIFYWELSCTTPCQVFS